jgi:Fe-S-cluster-containing dehydrogenase component
MMHKDKTQINRKSFLKGLLAVPVIASPLASFAKSKKELDNKDNFYSYLYDATKCIGCQACVNGCINVNTLPQALGDTSKKMTVKELPNLKNERALTEIQAYSKVSYVKEQCMHCLDPACVSACPVSAMAKDNKTGVVTNLPDKCIGCRYCMVACPFNIIKFEWNKTFPKILKCSMCIDTNLKDGKGIPGCVSACPQGALTFGRRKEIIDLAKKRIKVSPYKYLNNKVYGETEGGGTSVFILAKAESKTFKSIGLPEPDKFQHSPAEDSEFIQQVYTKGIAPITAYIAIAAVVYMNSKKHDDEWEE